MREKPPLRSGWRRVRGDAQGPVEICGTEISGNTGGVMSHGYYTAMNIKGSTITGNKAASYGGGLERSRACRHSRERREDWRNSRTVFIY